MTLAKRLGQLSGGGLANGRTLALRLIAAARPRLPFRWLPILRYGDPIANPFSGTTTPRQSRFAEHMKLFRNECTMISLKQLRDFFSGGALPPRPVLLTFDHVLAAPAKHRLQALSDGGGRGVFFATTNFAAQLALPPALIIARLLNQTKQTHLSLNYPIPLEFDLRTQRSEAINCLVALVNTHFRLDLAHLLTRLSEACALTRDEPAEEQLAKQQLLGWNELRHWQQANIAIEACGSSGRPLQTLSMRQVSDELAHCRVALQRNLGVSATAFALPAHTPAGATSALRSLFNANGYELCFLAEGGVTPLWKKPAPLQIGRIRVNDDWSPAQLRTALHWPQLRRGLA